MEILSFGCSCSCLRLCILKQDPHSWQVSCETCLTLVEKSRSWIQGPCRCVCLCSWGAGLIIALRGAKCWRVCSALSWTLMEWSRPTPGLERSLSSTLRRTQTDWPVTSQMGMFTAHFNSLFTKSLIMGNTKANGGYALLLWDKNLMRGRLFGHFSTSKTQERVDLFIPRSFCLWTTL